jgi:methyl-accepting chemotaxis protein
MRDMSQENFQMVKSIDSSSEMLTDLSSSLSKELGRFKIGSDRGDGPSGEEG